MGANVKLGDYGLAVKKPVSKLHTDGGATGADEAAEEPPVSRAPALSGEAPSLDTVATGDTVGTGEDLTKGVGTALYSAPEQGASKYADKVDIWAAGIILFELLSPFQTNMERVTAIRALRNSSELPDGFEACYPEAAAVVRASPFEEARVC